MYNISMGHIRIENAQGRIPLHWEDFWGYRELLYFFAWRDIKLRYRQTLLGFSWALLQPAVLMLVFSVIFGKYAAMPSDDLPYPVFALAALIPWQFFVTVLGHSSKCLLNHQGIIKKVFFPRIFIPLSCVLVAVIDVLVALPILLVMAVAYRLPINGAILVLPVFLILSGVFALAIGIWISALTVRFRDIHHVLPFLTQLSFFLTPVAYPISLLPEGSRWALWLNPLSGAIQGIRWSLTGSSESLLGSLIFSFLITALLLVSGFHYFQKVEGKLDEQL